MSAAAGPERSTRVMFLALLWKELREGFVPLGLSSMVVVSVGLLFAALLSRSMASLGLAGGPGLPVSLFTLTSALVALLNGRARAVKERHPDRWALLTHRPVSRTVIFWAKAAAGLATYLFAAGVPLALATLWLATPGHRPMPFDLRMVLGDLADLLCGIVYFFAAFVMGQRPARAFGSRFLPFGAAIACSMTVIAVPNFSEAIAVIIAGVAASGAAAWGTFVAGGRYEPQPIAGRVALSAVLGAGLVVIIGIVSGAISLVTAVSSTNFGDLSSTGYAITSAAAVVRETTVRHAFAAPGGRTEIVSVSDFRGQPIAQYADSTTRSKMNAGVIATAKLPLNPDGEYAPALLGRGYRGTGNILVRLAKPVTGPSDESWFYLRRERLLTVYDNHSAQLIGWLGPDGFSAGRREPHSRFEGALDAYTELTYDQPLLAFPHAVYQLDLDHRRLQRTFAAPPGETVLGAASSGDSTATMTALGGRASFDAIVTTDSVYVQSSDGAHRLPVGRDPSTAGYGTVSVTRALLASGSPTFLRYGAAFGTLNAAARKGHADRIDQVDERGVVVAKFDLPADTAVANPQTDWGDVVLSAMPWPVTERAVMRVYRAFRGSNQSWNSTQMVSWIISLLSSLLSALLAFAIGRRCALERKRAKLWAALGFALGPVGVLVMLSLIERPVRETCAACGRARVVTRELCEHCSAPFSPPPLDGTEIFATPVTRIPVP